MVERMTATLVHRGPDDSGFWYEGQVGIGFRRLSILDLTPGGHQPMVSPDGDAVLVYNGEIFNYIELRDELRALGHQFHSTGDTEVLLASWRQWREGCLDRLVGMFAFVIWDRARQEFFGARDRFGIKPLYLFEGPDVVVMASEIKAITASGLYAQRENWRAIAGYVVTGQLDDGAQTCFEGIQQVMPSHDFRVGPGGPLRQHRYFSWPAQTLDRADDAPRQVAELLEESVRMRMRSDVPVGVCLSGGLDSTSIICDMARQRRITGDTAPLLAFNYNAAEYDESAWVAETVRETGATLVSLDTDVRRLWDSTPRVLHFHDEPLHSMNALIGFQLMGLARQHGAIVLLNGQGADEALAGYSSFYFDHWYTLMVTGRAGQAWREIDDYATAFGTDRRGLWAKVMRTAAFHILGSLPAYGLAARSARRFRHRRSRWFTRELTDQVPDRFGTVPHRLDEVQRVAVSAWPLPLYLRIEDRNSMAHSVEARLPFLDYRLVSYALQLPLDWKIKGRWNKYVLREAMRGRIPESVRTRTDKMGFPTPAGKWFARELFEPVRDVLGSRSARERGIYRTDALLGELDANRGGEVHEVFALFRAANVELWLAMLADRTATARSAA